MGDLLGSPRVASLFFFIASRDDGVWAKAYFIFIVFDGRWSFYAVVTVVSRWVNSEGLNHREWSWRGRHKEKRGTEHVGCDHTSTKAPDPIRTPKLSVLGRE